MYSGPVTDCTAALPVIVSIFSVQIYSASEQDELSMGERVRAGDQVREAGESEHFRGES